MSSGLRLGWCSLMSNTAFNTWIASASWASSTTRYSSVYRCSRLKAWWNSGTQLNQKNKCLQKQLYNAIAVTQCKYCTHVCAVAVHASALLRCTHQQCCCTHIKCHCCTHLSDTDVHASVLLVLLYNYIKVVVRTHQCHCCTYMYMYIIVAIVL